MPRFYISDGAVPGRRAPLNEYGTKSGSQSDVLNEAQAISRGRKLVLTQGVLPTGRYVRLSFDFAVLPLDVRINVTRFKVFNDVDVNVALNRPVAVAGPNRYGPASRTDITSASGSYDDSLWYDSDSALIVTTPRRTLTVDLGVVSPIKRVRLSPMWTGSWTIGVSCSVDGTTWSVLTAAANFLKTGNDQILY